ncbi:hypothetical protein SAMN05428959_102876 [Duganella sp. CF517]|uniref:hypothetical protein n=1 Tax=Duganella sp. CF517 TaxID=1881038 RepID=UPI0008C5203D|nr:hypothetical protein [Duganella sp. CF517]SEN67925.1 hypothetical protein SAMN05428959_102876 [Duganella sp. CF517]
MITLISSMRRALACAILPATVLLLGACGTPYRPPQFVEPDPQFPGLIDLAAGAEGRVADVLLVHGMCTHDAGWAAHVVGQLTRALTDATTPPGARPPTFAAVDPQIQIVPSTVETPAGRLRFDALIWSPLTVPLKRQLCYDQTDKSPICAGEPPYPFIRARINARVKDVLIDDCLPDPLIYQGVARDDIQRRMRDAILQVLAASDAPAGLPLMVVSESLGSKILWDTLLNMTHEQAGSPASQLARRAVDRLRFLVMAANPAPLLSLAEQQIGSGGVGAFIQAVPVPPDSLQVLLQERRARRPRSLLDRRLTLVALTDPNDLLSYTLPVERYASEEVTVYNILVSNAPTWLGLLERPDRAHLEYLDNPDVGRLIACGLPSSRLCKRE